jgi:hypothetical protein
VIEKSIPMLFIFSLALQVITGTVNGSIGEPQVYQPSLFQVQQYPPNSCCVPVDSEVKIYAKVFDEFAEINTATLSYSFKDGYTNTTKMKLINGDKLNGTYFGIIQPHSEVANNTFV